MSDGIKAIEDVCKTETPVVLTIAPIDGPNVPMVIPEINLNILK